MRQVLDAHVHEKNHFLQTNYRTVFKLKDNFIKHCPGCWMHIHSYVSCEIFHQSQKPCGSVMRSRRTGAFPSASWG